MSNAGKTGTAQRITWYIGSGWQQFGTRVLKYGVTILTELRVKNS